MNIVMFNWKDICHRSAGGAEEWTHQVCSRWAGTGHDVTLFAAEVPGRPTVETIEGPEGAYRVVRGGSRYTTYVAARRWWRETRPRADLVVDQVNTRPFFAHRFTNTPTVAMAHQIAREVWWHEMPHVAAAAGRFVAEPWWLWKMRNQPFWTVSQSSADSLVSCGVKDVTVLPQGSSLGDPPSGPQLRDDTFTMVFCARLVPMKRPDAAMEALAHVRRYIPDARLKIIGDGPLKEVLEQRRQPGVEFCGRLSSVERDAVMARAHVLVATSVREGWGLTVSEAAALGTRSVAYPAPGLVDSVPAAEGILAQDCTPAALAEAIVDNEALLRKAHGPTTHGTVPWSVVADTFLEGALSHVESGAGRFGTARQFAT